MLGRKQSNILIVKTDDLASYVATEPVFAAIRNAHKDARISLLTVPALQRISRASPYFDQVAAFPNFRDNEARRDFVKQIKSAKFERVYDLSGEDNAKKLRAALGPFGPKWMSAPIQSPKPGRAGMSMKAIDKLIDAASIDYTSRLPDFSWALEARKDSANMKPSWYGISGAFGLLLPSSDPQKRWPASQYGGMATMMARHGFMPVLAGPKELHHLGDEIAYESPQLVDLSGKTDHLQLAALAREAAFFVSDGADEMHLAVAVGCEGVTLAKGAGVVASPDGRHVVTLSAADNLGQIEPPFVWRTLSNMGLILGEDSAPMTAQAR